MSKMQKKRGMIKPVYWLKLYLIIFYLFILGMIFLVVYIDPYFHYHKPMEQFFYSLYNQRSQNDGIEKHFDYNAIISGTSMTENFKTSEADELFGANFIKIPFSGGSFDEIDKNIKTSIAANENVRLVIRSLDMQKILADKDAISLGVSGEYPFYLYNSNPFDDAYYILNKDTILRCIEMFVNCLRGVEGGITSFDDYSNWMNGQIFGKEFVLKNHSLYENDELQQISLNEKEKRIILDNINQNILETAKENPNIEFYYFIPPYSVVWWGDLYYGQAVIGSADCDDGNGKLGQMIEAEEITIELLLNEPNIRVYSYNNFYDITTDLNNYKDWIHYGEWINSNILLWMKQGNGELTLDNYKDELQKEREYYSFFDYNVMFIK